MEKKYWFRPKHYGYGVVPISWEGYLATLVFLILILSSAYINHFFTDFISKKDTIHFLLDTFILILLFKLTMKKRIRGGLGWRWGKE